MNKQRVIVKVKLLPGGRLPQYVNNCAAGADMYASEDRLIKRGKTEVVPCGVAIELPPGYEAQFRSRSGLAGKHSIFVLNSPGTIDSDYRGEMVAILTNLGTKDYEVKAGDRIGQIVVAPVTRARFNVVTELSETTRGEKGLGSTGK